MVSLKIVQAGDPVLRILARELSPKEIKGAQIQQLIDLMRKSNVRLVIVESFYPSNLARFVAENGHARLVVAPSDVGAAPAIKSYFDLVDAVLAVLTAS